MLMDPIKKAMYLGLGAISLTKEKAEELVDELIKQEETTEKERAGLVDHLVKEGQAQKNALEGKVSESVRKVVTDLGLPTRKEFETIVNRLDGIEKSLGTLKQGKRGKKG
jgi:polyhydroxyalkanoate synthesis regulator phasin